MKVTQTVAKEISSAIRELGEHRESEDGSDVYLLEDVTAAFGPDAQGKLVFQGLSFEMVGRDFHVLPNLDLVVSETVGEAESAGTEVYVIEDANFAELTGEYLSWRAQFLRTLKI